MSGTLGLSTPWARGAFPPADRDAIEAALPEGTRIMVTGHAHGAGRSFRLIGYEGDHEVIRLEWRRNPIESALFIAGRLTELARA